MTQNGLRAMHCSAPEGKVCTGTWNQSSTDIKMNGLISTHCHRHCHLSLIFRSGSATPSHGLSWPWTSISLTLALEVQKRTRIIKNHQESWRISRNFKKPENLRWDFHLDYPCKISGVLPLEGDGFCTSPVRGRAMTLRWLSGPERKYPPKNTQHAKIRALSSLVWDMIVRFWLKSQ